MTRFQGFVVRSRALVRPSDFVPHVFIQSNHIHLLVESTNKDVLSTGVQRLAIAITKSLGRAGKAFAFRYHRVDITSPLQTRNALAYVLNNWLVIVKT